MLRNNKWAPNKAIVITRHEKDGTHEYIYKFIFCFFINSILAVIYVYKKVSETD